MSVAYTSNSYGGGSYREVGREQLTRATQLDVVSNAESERFATLFQERSELAAGTRSVAGIRGGSNVPRQTVTLTSERIGQSATSFIDGSLLGYAVPEGGAERSDGSRSPVSRVAGRPQAAVVPGQAKAPQMVSPVNGSKELSGLIASDPHHQADYLADAEGQISDGLIEDNATLAQSLLSQLHVGAGPDESFLALSAPADNVEAGVSAQSEPEMVDISRSDRAMMQRELAPQQAQDGLSDPSTVHVTVAPAGIDGALQLYVRVSGAGSEDMQLEHALRETVEQSGHLLAQLRINGVERRLEGGR